MMTRNFPHSPDAFSLACIILGVELCGFCLPAFAQETWPEPIPAAMLPLKEEEAQNYFNKNNWKKAEAAYQTLFRSSPLNEVYMQRYVKTLLFQEKRKEALEALSKAADWAKKKRHKSKIIDRLHVVSRTFFTDQTAERFQDAMNFLKAKKFTAAGRKMDEVVAKEKNNVEALLRRGQIYILDRKVDLALKDLVKARELNPHEPEVALWLGRAHFLLEQLPDSKEQLEAAHQLLPKSELSPVWLAETLVSLNERERALQVLEQDLRKHPFHVQSLVMLAKFRVPGPVADLKILWSARKELQIAMSRFEEYQSKHHGSFETELGLNPNDPEKIKGDISTSLREIERKIQIATNETPKSADETNSP